MRIHFVLPQLEPFYGMEKGATLLLLGLREAGHQVSATVLSGGVPEPATGLDVDLLGISRNAWRLGVAVPYLRHRIARLPANAHVVASGLWASAPVGLALVGSGRSYVSWEHSLLGARLELDRRVRVLSWIVHRVAVRPRLVIAVSKAVARDLRQRFGCARVAVVPNVSDGPAAPPRPASSGSATVEMLSTGAFRPYKNYLTAVSSMRFLPDHYRLSLAGDGVQEKILRDRVRDLRLQSRVRFLGRVGDVPALLRTSDLLLHPSVSETFGFSLIEAADHGLPVVALPVPSVDELIPDLVPGTLAGGTTAGALAEAVQGLVVRGRPTAGQYADAWRRRRERYSATAVAAGWLHHLAGADAPLLDHA